MKDRYQLIKKTVSAMLEEKGWDFPFELISYYSTNGELIFQGTITLDSEERLSHGYKDSDKVHHYICDILRNDLKARLQ